MSAAPYDTVNVLGVSVMSLTLEQLIHHVDGLIDSGQRHKVMYANVHVLNSAYVDCELRNILRQANVVYCDGFGVKLGAWLLGGSLPERMTGADWIDDLCANCREMDRSLFLLGGLPDVAARAGEVLSERFPGLKIVGTHHGFLHNAPVENQRVIDLINQSRPDILLVGMGTPLQERWMSCNQDTLTVPVCWAVGALFDYVADVVPRGPRWMLDHGLEWLYRLILEPKRLGRRYLAGNPLFIARVLGQRISSAREKE